MAELKKRANELAAEADLKRRMLFRVAGKEKMASVFVLFLIGDTRFNKLCAAHKWLPEGGDGAALAFPLRITTKPAGYRGIMPPGIPE